MASWKWRQVRSALTKKGFVQGRSTDHEYYHFWVEDRKTVVRTKVSHGAKGELNSSSQLMTSYQRDLFLDRQSLEDLLNCPLSGQQYAQLLIENGRIWLGDEESDIQQVEN